jgi:RNA polymerase sigma-70 factor (ECF subfamily)
VETVSETDLAARFTALAQEVAIPLRRYVVRRADPATVDDIVSEVFLVLWRRLGDVPTDDPLPWTYGVARNCLANSRRAVARHLRLVDRLRSTSSHDHVPPAGDHTEDHAEVHEALAGLRPLDREIVTLWAWEGLAPREIATVTGLTANAVSIRLHKAKKAVATALGKNEPTAGQESSEGRRPR